MLGLSAIISTVGGSLLGGILKLIQTSQEARQAERLYLLQAAGIVAKNTENARAMKGKEIQFTRRLLALISTLPLLTITYLVVQDPLVTFNIPVQMSKGGFSFLAGLFSGGPSEEVKYIAVQGYVVLLQFFDIMGFVYGFYFSVGGTRK